MNLYKERTSQINSGYSSQILLLQKTAEKSFKVAILAFKT
jgi:hypothetical protein